MKILKLNYNNTLCSNVWIVTFKIRQYHSKWSSAQCLKFHWFKVLMEKHIFKSRALKDKKMRILILGTCCKKCEDFPSWLWSHNSCILGFMVLAVLHILYSCRRFFHDCKYSCQRACIHLSFYCTFHCFLTNMETLWKNKEITNGNGEETTNCLWY